VPRRAVDVHELVDGRDRQRTTAGKRQRIDLDPDAAVDVGRERGVGGDDLQCALCTGWGDLNCTDDEWFRQMDRNRTARLRRLGIDALVEHEFDRRAGRQVTES